MLILSVKATSICNSLLDELKEPCSVNQFKIKLEWYFHNVVFGSGYCHLILSTSFYLDELNPVTACDPDPTTLNSLISTTTAILLTACFLPARRYASAGNRDRNVSVCPSVCLSVCLSVTRRYCVKTKKASGMISSPSGSPKTLVFWRQISSPNGGPK